MFNVGPSGTFGGNQTIVGGRGGSIGGPAGPLNRPQHTGMGPQYNSNMSPNSGLMRMQQRLRPQPPMGVMNSAPNNGGGFMAPPPMDNGGMMMPPPNMGPGLMGMPPPQAMPGPMSIDRITGGMNGGVMGPQPGGLWSAYNNMVQGDGAPQKRNLTY